MVEDISDKKEPDHEESVKHDQWSQTHSGQLTSFSLPPDVLNGNHRRKITPAKLLSVFLVLICLLAGFLGGWIEDNHFSDNSDVNKLTSGAAKEIIVNQGQAISDIAANVGQSVVSVLATQSTTAATPDSNTLFGVNGFTTNPAPTTESQDAGTGIIISSDGLIITNRHVVPVGTTSISVTLADGTQYNNVQLIGRTGANDSLDIAFLKITTLNGRKLVPATLGDSNAMQVGDPVVAIGNALGQFQNTVTSGIISGYGRSVQASDSTGATSEDLDDLIQTDAAINEGNSGGPLTNLNGQVVGINVAVASDAQNIGFAIPINDVTGLIKSVEQTGKLEQPYLGIEYIPLSTAVAQQYHLKLDNGAYIPTASSIGAPSIIANGPAASSGLKEGDIITKVNDVSIDQNTSLTSILDKLSAGQRVTLTVVRGAKTITVKITLGTAPTG